MARVLEVSFGKIFRPPSFSGSDLDVFAMIGFAPKLVAS
jgi:hypothetical protein